MVIVDFASILRWLITYCNHLQFTALNLTAVDKKEYQTHTFQLHFESYSTKQQQTLHTQTFYRLSACICSDVYLLIGN